MCDDNKFLASALVGIQTLKIYGFSTNFMIYKKIHYHLLIAASAILSICTLTFKSIQPVSWPATASLPGVINMIDNSKLSNDFFTLSSQNTPIIFFQKLLFAISYFTDHDAPKAMILLGGIIAAFYFPIFFLITQKALENLIFQSSFNRLRQQKLLAISILVNFSVFLLLIFISPRLTNYFTSMMWPPIFINPNPYIFSMLLGLSSGLVSSKSRIASVALLVTSCLIHPIMGLFTSIFLFILFNNFYSTRITSINFSFTFIPIFVVYIFLFLKFPQSGMNTQDFIEIYINQRHPHHYLVSTSLQIKSWLLILISLLIETSILFATRSKLRINALIALLFFILMPPIHYFLTEIYPIKFIAILGFPRFFTFAIYFVIFFGISCFISLLNTPYISRLNFINLTFLFKYKNHSVNFLILTIIFCLAFNISIVSFLHREFIYIDSFMKEFTLKYYSILNLIPDSKVIMVLDGDDFHFGLFGKKNLYSSEAFPFSESRFYEYSDRWNIFLSCEKNLSVDSLTKAKAKYQLNYVLMNSDRLTHLPGAKPIATTDNLSLIDLDDYLGKNP